MAFSKREFGYVTVWTEDVGSFGVDKPTVEISWSSVGSVSIMGAIEFAEDMTKAIRFAASESNRLGIGVK